MPTRAKERAKMARWNRAKNASASGTKNRLRVGTYLLQVSGLSDKTSRKKIDYDVAEFAVVEVLSSQKTMFKGRGESEAKEMESNPVGDHASEMFWFDESDDLVDLTFGRFKQFCCACLGIGESDADDFEDDEWESEVEGLHGRGHDAEPAAGKKIIAIVTKETVSAKTHNYLKTTYMPYDDPNPIL